MAAFIRWNESTQIWEKAVNPNVVPPTWNHLPVANPTLALDIANKQYVDAAVAGVSGFVPYVGATADVNIGTFRFIGSRFIAKANVLANGPTLGSSPDYAQKWTEPGVAYGLTLGISASGDSWIQSQRFDGGLATYNINLNPFGGRVAIGNTAPQIMLHVGSANTAPLQPYDGTFVNLINASQIAIRNSLNGVEGGLIAHTDTLFIGSWTNSHVYFRTNNTNRAAIKNTGNFEFLTGIIHSNSLTAAINANVDNWNPAGLANVNFIFASPSGAFTIAGIAAQEDGRVIGITNNTGNTLTFLNLASSVTADRFILPLGNIVVGTWKTLYFRCIGGFGWLLIGQN